MISTYNCIILPSFMLLSKSERLCHFSGLTAGLIMENRNCLHSSILTTRYVHCKPAISSQLEDSQVTDLVIIVNSFGDLYPELQLFRVIRILSQKTFHSGSVGELLRRMQFTRDVHATLFASHDTVLFLQTLFSHQPVRHYSAFSLLVSFILFKS